MGAERLPLALKGRRGALVWVSFALLLTLACVPVLSTVLPPLLDYPNHLARMHLLAEGGNRFYAVHWAPLPNLAQDLIVPPLARLLAPESASKLFVVMTFGIIAASTLALNRVATGGWRLWPLCAFLLLYNRTFLWGFLNYLFGIGVALSGVALWLALESRPWWLRLLASSLAALFCYLSHIAAFGFYALVIVGVELAPAFADLQARRWRPLGRRLAIDGVQFIMPAALFAYWRPAAGQPIAVGAIWRKADLLFSVFDNYSHGFDIACFAIMLGLLGWMLFTRRLRLAPRLLSALGIVFIAYLLLPSQLYGGSGADHRLVIAMFLLFIAASAPRLRNRRTAILVGSAAVLLLVARLAIIEHVWREADRVYVADLTGIDALPRDAKLAVAAPASAVHVVAVPEVHLPALAAARRDAFVPTVFAAPGQQPIAFNPPYAALAAAASPPQIWAAVTANGDAADARRVLAVIQQYDYLAMVGAGSLGTQLSRCLRPFFGQPSFAIFAVVHDLRCADPSG